ncbi:MAG: hydroxyacid dehydrogenase [bacterium]|nr:hydroxyacid dehydrogenase [bacterium]
MKIAFFDVEEWEKVYFQDHLTDHSLYFCNTSLTKDNLREAQGAEVLSTMVFSQLTKELLSQLPDISLITTRSTGFDHIDLEYCREKKITVCNVPEYGANTVAEHTFALILALSRKIIPSAERTRQGNFSLDGLRGFDLYGKTFGVVGLGHIGKAAVRIAKGFGMNVIVFSRSPDAHLADELAVRFVDLPTLLSESDVISLHVPLTRETRHLINKENILHCKKGSILINTARGGVVDTEAVLLGLEKGILAGAGLDVLEEECFIKEETQLLTDEFLKECDIKTQLLNHVLLKKKNVIITPHNAFNSAEALGRILSVTLQNITSCIEGKITNRVV